MGAIGVATWVLLDGFMLSNSEAVIPAMHSEEVYAKPRILQTMIKHQQDAHSCILPPLEEVLNRQIFTLQIWECFELR